MQEVGAAGCNGGFHGPVMATVMGKGVGSVLHAEERRQGRAGVTRGGRWRLGEVGLGSSVAMGARACAREGRRQTGARRGAVAVPEEKRRGATWAQARARAREKG